jgi:hypothetical protein
MRFYVRFNRFWIRGAQLVDPLARVHERFPLGPEVASKDRHERRKESLLNKK